MSINGLFDIGKSALLASQAALGTISNNIANVNTPGYTKQDIVLSIATPMNTNTGYIGMGVTVTGVVRSYDRFLQAQLLGQQQNQGRSAVMDQMWGQIEALINEQQGSGLSGPLADFFNAWNDVATAPESLAARSVLLQKAGALTQSAKSIESAMTGVISTANMAITDAASQINSLASDIAALNYEITQAEAGSATANANDLRDQRDSMLTNLSKLVDFTSYEDSNGAINIAVGMRSLVSGTRANAMSSRQNISGNQDIYLDGITITANIQGGKLGGLIASRNSIQDSTLYSLRKFIASITQQVNALHAQGTDMNGNPGGSFFGPLQLTLTGSTVSATPPTITLNSATESALTLDEYDITFNAAGTTYAITNRQTGAVTNGAYASGNPITFDGITVTISGTTTATDSFTISPLTRAAGGFGVALTDPHAIAAADSTTIPAETPPGGNGIARKMANLTAVSISALGNTTFSGYYSQMISTVGVAKRTTADTLTFDNTLMANIQTRRDSVSGVSLDEEAASLLRYQRSYQAGAKLISVTDELLQTILQL